MAAVILLRSSSHIGGVERQLLDFAMRLRNDGWSPRIICFYRGTGDHPLARAAAEAGLDARTIPDPGPLSTRPYLRLREAISEMRPSLLHSCDYRSDILASLARARTSLPHLAESHGHTLEGKWMRYWNRLDLWMLRRVQAVVAVSSAWETQLAAAGVSPRRLHVIGNSRAILSPEPPPSAVAVSQPGPYLLYAGRMSPEKGLEILLSAWESIRNRFPSATLWVLGDTATAASIRRLEKLLDRPGIYRLGYQPDIRPWLLAADALVTPSRQEAWGMTVFEALCAGTAVLATRVGGLPQLCRGVPHAHLVAPNDEAALLAGLATVLAPDFPRGADLGQTYKSQSRFDPAHRYQQLLVIYRQF